MRDIFHKDCGAGFSPKDGDDCQPGNLDAAFIGFGKVNWRLN